MQHIFWSMSGYSGKPIDQVDPVARRVVNRWPGLSAIHYETCLNATKLNLAVYHRRELAGFLWLRPDQHDYEYDPDFEDDTVWPGPIAQQMSADTGGVLPPLEAFEALRGLRPTDFLALLPGSPLRQETVGQVLDRVSAQVVKCLEHRCQHTGTRGGNLWLAGCARSSLGDQQEMAELAATWSPPAPSGSTKRAVVQCDPMTHEEIKVWPSPEAFVATLGIEQSRSRGAVTSALTRAAKLNEQRAKEGLHMSRHTAQGFAWRWSDVANPPPPPVIPKVEKERPAKEPRNRPPRDMRGARNPRAKLTMEDVARMRRLREQGLHYKQIATEFGVSVPTTWRVLTGRTWHSRQGDQQ